MRLPLLLLSASLLLTGCVGHNPPLNPPAVTEPQPDPQPQPDPSPQPPAPDPRPPVTEPGPQPGPPAPDPEPEPDPEPPAPEPEPEPVVPQPLTLSGQVREARLDYQNNRVTYSPWRQGAQAVLVEVPVNNVYQPLPVRGELTAAGHLNVTLPVLSDDQLEAFEPVEFEGCTLEVGQITPGLRIAYAWVFTEGGQQLVSAELSMGAITEQNQVRQLDLFYADKGGTLRVRRVCSYAAGDDSNTRELEVSEIDATLVPGWNRLNTTVRYREEVQGGVTVKGTYSITDNSPPPNNWLAPINFRL